jgi:hypothetical protein
MINICINEPFINDLDEHRELKVFKISKYIRNNCLSHKWLPSTCRIKGIDSVNIIQRNSLSYTDKFYINFGTQFDKLFNSLNIINPNSYYDDSGMYLSLSSITNWELIRYDVGGKFEKHKDRLRENIRDGYYIHTHTGLLYPPGSFSNYTGGELIFYNGNEETIIETSKFDKYTLIIFDINTLHKINPVISGSRYVFKGQLLSYNPNYVASNDEEELCD